MVKLLLVLSSLSMCSVLSLAMNMQLDLEITVNIEGLRRCESDFKPKIIFVENSSDTDAVQNKSRWITRSYRIGSPMNNNLRSFSCGNINIATAGNSTIR